MENINNQSKNDKMENILKKLQLKFHVDNKNIITINKWSKTEDEKLLKLIGETNDKIKWNDIASQFTSKSSKQCYARYRQINPSLNRGKWTQEEENKLFKLIEKFGTNWAKIASTMKTRSGKQIRNHYYSCVNTSSFTPEEDLKIEELYLKYGTKFSLMTNFIKGKSTEQIKQRFYSYVKKHMLCETTPSLNNKSDETLGSKIHKLSKFRNSQTSKKSSEFNRNKGSFSSSSKSSGSSNFQKSIILLKILR